MSFTHGPGLVGGDGGDGGAEHMLVVKADGRHAEEVGGKGRGRIPRATESRLYDAHVHPCLSEGESPEHGQEFEIGEVGTSGVEDAVAEKGPQVGLQHPAIDADAFARCEEMGRGVETRAKPVCLCDGGEKGRRGALAVGAHHLRHGVGRTAEVEGGEGCMHPVESEIHMKEAKPLEMGDNVAIGAERHVDSGGLVSCGYNAVGCTSYAGFSSMRTARCLPLPRPRHVGRQGFVSPRRGAGALALLTVPRSCSSHRT